MHIIDNALSDRGSKYAVSGGPVADSADAKAVQATSVSVDVRGGALEQADTKIIRARARVRMRRGM